MKSILIVVLFSVVALGLFVVGLSLTLIFKGHHIQSEISTNPNMQKLGIKCAVQESRENQGTDCDDDKICTGSCSSCDVKH